MRGSLAPKSLRCLLNRYICPSEGGCCCECPNPLTVVFEDFVVTGEIPFGEDIFFVAGDATVDGTPDIPLAIVYNAGSGKIFSTSCISNNYSMAIPLFQLLDSPHSGHLPVSLLGGTYNEETGTGTIIVCGEAMLALLKGEIDGFGGSAVPVDNS